jgi:hypothetical protein
MKRPFDDAFLLKYSEEHLWYEVWMFFEMVDALTRYVASGYVASTTSSSIATVIGPAAMVNSIAPPPGSSYGPSTMTANAYVESFMVHLRNLIDFLWPTKVFETDVVAADFCAGGVWNTSISKPLTDARTRVHKELAHLTTERISSSPARKQWDFKALAHELKVSLEDFTGKALPARLSPRVKTAIR